MIILKTDLEISRDAIALVTLEQSNLQMYCKIRQEDDTSTIKQLCSRYLYCGTHCATFQVAIPGI